MASPNPNSTRSKRTNFFLAIAVAAIGAIGGLAGSFAGPAAPIVAGITPAAQAAAQVKICERQYRGRDQAFITAESPACAAVLFGVTNPPGGTNPPGDQ